MKYKPSKNEITPVSELYTYDLHGIPSISQNWKHDINSYSLTVCGFNIKPIKFSFAQIQNEFEIISSKMILRCMQGLRWGCVKMTGPRLIDILTKVGIPSKAYKIALHGAEKFDTDLTITEISEEPDNYLPAYLMNGKPLTPEHGFPLRSTADGHFGHKWCKWLTKIEYVNFDYRGYYESGAP